ncbi:hypothetical protein PT285_03790 [Lactobacillus sp. ESL0791]|uniref:hypothetical protein n=1 Tax=Lactobacillus sp. ESL0791 TaxID=2983234 RepID=UPI0023F8615C|nr:hypothetical protein [Lactobacillus sp. ESL0791]MDF7638531.1 hypothetical protein [Lactobacillus sp. ESL0791]
MRLTDFLQITADLDQQTKFYLSLGKNMLPLAKIKIAGNECLLYPGKIAMTKEKFNRLIKNLHHRSITLWLVDGKKKIATFGIQIAPDGQKIKLT